MKLVVNKAFFLVLMAFSLAVASSLAIAQVYKVVDADGNITYTDQPPADGAKPVKLAPISVIEAPDYPTPAKAGADDANGDEAKEPPLRFLRKEYADFAIIFPQQEESVWHPDGPVPVQWGTGKPVREGMQVTLIVDGVQQAVSASQLIPISSPDRGEHRIEAQLHDARNRLIATAEPVVFFVRRPNLYNRAGRR